MPAGAGPNPGAEALSLLSGTGFSGPWRPKGTPWGAVQPGLLVTQGKKAADQLQQAEAAKGACTFMQAPRKRD